MGDPTEPDSLQDPVLRNLPLRIQPCGLWPAGSGLRDPARQDAALWVRGFAGWPCGTCLWVGGPAGSGPAGAGLDPWVRRLVGLLLRGGGAGLSVDSWVGGRFGREAAFALWAGVVVDSARADPTARAGRPTQRRGQRRSTAVRCTWACPAAERWSGSCWRGREPVSGAPRRRSSGRRAGCRAYGSVRRACGTVKPAQIQA
jgi:hypothetical protein